MSLRTQRTLEQEGKKKKLAVKPANHKQLDREKDHRALSHLNLVLCLSWSQGLLEARVMRGVNSLHDEACCLMVGTQGLGFQGLHSLHCGDLGFRVTCCWVTAFGVRLASARLGLRMWVGTQSGLALG